MSELTKWKARKKYVTVDGRRMAYVEMGQGRPIVFQHGNPTSSYLWRNILPQLSEQGRCIAIDLIGMGDSDKLPDSGPQRYTFAEHRHYWSGALAALGVERDVVLVVHDWGSALGFDWLRSHPEAVAGVSYMEALVAGLEWSDWPAAAVDLFKAFRSPEGEKLVLEQNVFIENVFPGAMLYKLSAEDMDVYREPYREAGEDRRPTLTWPRQLPIAGEPADVSAVVAEYSRFMAQTEVPKLFINAEPGMILTGRLREFARSWKNQREVTVEGLHFIQEDSPDAIASALVDWVAGLPAGR
ncbi:MAG: haloalkane dehalogenase [Gammaproteobacteria bacterium]